MTSSNRLRLSICREVTKGVTPASPRMRIARITGESMQFNPEYIDSEEIRFDRMMGDPILTMQSGQGGLNFEFSYPVDESPLSEFIRSGMLNVWSNTPQRDNDGVADSVITDVAATGVITVTTGAAFAIGHLIRTTGFTTPANNGVFRITTGSATVPSVGAALLTAEPAPPATARVKVVGFAGVAGDITALADGLGSTALNFTTLGLAVGQVIKIGGTAVGDRFNTAALNGYARITAITATKLTLDNLPVGWTTDTGTGKTIKVWFGDQIKNGTTGTSMTIERGFMGQAIPTYIVNTGMHVNTLTFQMASKDKIKGTVEFMGLGGSQSTTTLDATPDPETTVPVFASNSNFQRLTEAGAQVVGPNFIKSLNFSIANNYRQIENLGSVSPVDMIEGECTVTGQVETYFGDNTILGKFYTGTPTSLLCVMQKFGRACALQFPRATYRGGGNPSAAGKNQDVMMSMDFTASKDELTQAHVIMDRFEYVEG